MVRTLPRPTSEFLYHMIANLQKYDEHGEEFDNDIHDFYKSNKMQPAVYEQKAKYVRMLKSYLTSSEGVINQMRAVGIEIRELTAFGSFPTACATNDSDLDLCVCASSARKNTMPVTVLQGIFRDLKFNVQSRTFFENSVITNIDFIGSAKVPIIKFKIDGVPVDLSATLEKAPPRTSLAAKYINAYCQLDDRFPVLVTILKIWLKSEGCAEDHQRDFPNSYSITLLLIHVLQWYEILPNLIETNPETFQVKYFTDWELADMTKNSFKWPLDENTVSQHKLKETSKLTVLQLLHLFAEHYSKTDLLFQCRFNMRNGEIEDRCGDQSSIRIHDNYDTRNPARSARTSQEFVGALRELCNVIKTPVKDKFDLMMTITRQKTYIPPVRNFPVNIPPRYLPVQQHNMNAQLMQEHMRMQHMQYLLQFQQPMHHANGMMMPLPQQAGAGFNRRPPRREMQAHVSHWVQQQQQHPQ